MNADPSFTDYDTPDDKEHVLNLIRWLWRESYSAGGDGDGTWFSQRFKVSDLLPLVEQVKVELCPHWNVSVSEDGLTICWSHQQSSVIITNDIGRFRATPDYEQVLIRW